jgi:hypothetical protein
LLLGEEIREVLLSRFREHREVTTVDHLLALSVFMCCDDMMSYMRQYGKTNAAQATPVCHRGACFDDRGASSAPSCGIRARCSGSWDSAQARLRFRTVGKEDAEEEEEETKEEKEEE